VVFATAELARQFLDRDDGVVAADGVGDRLGRHVLVVARRIATGFAQQHHEAVLEPLGDRRDRNVLQFRRILTVGADEAHLAGLWYGVDDAIGLAQQPCLQQARCFVGSCRREEGAARGVLAQRGGRTGREDLARAQQQHVVAALGLIEVGGAE
jgi:hypothetical protein